MANPTQIISALSYRDYKSHNRIQNNHLNPDNIGTLHSLYIHLLNINQENHMEPDNIGKPDIVGKPDNIDKSDIFSNLNYTILIYRQSRYYRQTCRANSLLHHI